MNITINKQMLLIGAAVALAVWLFKRNGCSGGDHDGCLREEIWGSN